MPDFTKLGFLAVASVGVGSLLAACSSAATTTGSGGSSSSSHSAATGTGGGSSSHTASSSATGTGGSTPEVPTFVAHLDPMKGQLPEGLFVTGSKAYVGLAVLGKIVTVDLPGGAVTDFGSIPAPPAMNGGFMLGIVVDAAGEAYVGFGGGPGTVVKNGVYKIPAAGGAVTAPWASDAAMNFPNGLILDATGNVFVADSGGFIFKIAKDASVTKWAADPSLVGTGTGLFAAPFPIGANGIVQSGSAFYVSNTNIGQIVKIPIKADGTAGAPTVFAGPDCNVFGGIDGIALDADGSILAVLNAQNKIIRVGLDGKATTLFSGKPLDNPASTSIATVGGKKALYVTNSAFFDKAAPAPGLLELPLP